MSGSATLSDGASLVLVNQVGGDYGFQKMFGFIGLATFSPISGALIDYFSEVVLFSQFDNLKNLFIILNYFLKTGLPSICSPFFWNRYNLNADNQSQLQASGTKPY